MRLSRLFLSCGFLFTSVTPAQDAPTESVPLPSSDLVAEGATLQKLPGRYAFTEGPAADAAGNVFFTDQPNDSILKWDAKTQTIDEWMKPAGRSNGMFFDANGNLISCADAQNELWSIAPDKTVTVLVNNLEGKRLNGPNDVWVHPSGALYFTDPLYVREYWDRSSESELKGRFVYWMKDLQSTPVPVDRTLKQPNGIIGTADGKTLYVADIGAKKTFRYPIQEDGTLGERQLFCEMGSDGMTLDHLGNLYLTGNGVHVFNPEGQLITHIEVPERWTANVTFGGENHDQLFITASESVYLLPMKVSGTGKK